MKVFAVILLTCFSLFFLMYFFYTKRTNKIYPAKGTLAGKFIRLDMDSTEAKNLLESSENFTSSEIPDIELQKKMVKEYSVDYTSVYLLKTIYNDTEKLKHQKKYLDLSDRLIERPALTDNETSRLKKFKLIFVPGLAYKIDTTTGADFARQRIWFEKRGIRTDIIETDELGLTLKNAEIINQYIQSYSENKKIILISASKGGLDLIYYLEKLAQKNELQKIHAWVNVGGILKGTLIAEEHCKFPLSVVPAALLALKGKTLEIVGDIRRSSKEKIFQELKFTDSIKVVHLIGVPFQF
ncbi:MAG: hypothetical protein IT569_06000 [Leptospiraceae bacterium]|nr:hypothetical protein [Leptospiraceae bacterium]